MEKADELLESLGQELRRGTIVLCVLSQCGEAQYGYSLVQRLNEQQMEMDANTLYPLLRRLEKQGLLCSQWITDGAKPRKYYSRTELGGQVYQALRRQWRQLGNTMESFLKEEEA